mmetsp:Transcript_5556/g.21343  ORF Transcript_5556/g.21343 Transcript_5556/m.21343 type:complete len:905 (-) Transcript_5556:936-3650(-)
MLGRQLQEGLVGRHGLGVVAGLQPCIAEVQPRQRPARVHLDRLLEPARRVGELAAAVEHEAEVVGGQRELRLQRQCLLERGLGLVVAALAVELQAAVVGALGGDAGAGVDAGGRRGQGLVLAVQALDRHLHRAGRAADSGRGLAASAAGFVELGGELAGLVVQLGHGAAQARLLGGGQLEHELAALAARQAAEGRRLVRDGRHGGRHVGGQFGRGDEAVAVQVGLAAQRLQQRPGEHRVAAGAVVGHLLVGAAGGHHLAAYTARIGAGEIAVGRRAAAAREAQAGVAGVDDEQRMLGRDGLGHLLQLRHRDRVGLQVVQAGVHRHDIAHLAAAGQLARAAVAGEEDEHAVVALHALGVTEAVVQRLQDVGSRGVRIGQQRHMVGLETEARDQGITDGLGVAHGVRELGPGGVAIDADHQRMALAVELARGGGRRGSSLVGGHHELAVLVAGKAPAVGGELVQHQRQGLHGAGVDVVEEHDAALLLVQLGQHAGGDALGDGVAPVQRVHVPHHRAQFQRFDGGQGAVVARTVGKPKQRVAIATRRVQQRLRVGGLFLDLDELELAHQAVREAVVGDLVAGGQHALGHRRAVAGLGLAIRADLAEVLPELEEHRRGLVALQDLQDLVGVAGVRAVVEAQQHGLGRQLVAKDLAVLGRHAAHRARRGGRRHLGRQVVGRRQPGAVLLHHRLAAVQGAQLGEVVAPLLALELDAALGEAAEHVLELLLVGLLHLGQRVDVVLRTARELDAVQRLARFQARCELLQHLLEGQPVGVEPAGLAFDARQQRGGGFQRVGLERRIGQRLLALQQLMEQLLAQGLHLAALHGRQRGLAVHQHNDLAVQGQQCVGLLAQLRGGAGVLRGGSGRQSGGHVGRALAGAQRQGGGQQQGGRGVTQGGHVRARRRGRA